MPTGRALPAAWISSPFPLWLLAVSIAFAVVVSVVAGIYPALRAARVDPIRAPASH